MVEGGRRQGGCVEDVGGYSEWLSSVVNHWFPRLIGLCGTRPCSNPIVGGGEIEQKPSQKSFSKYFR